MLLYLVRSRDAFEVSPASASRSLLRALRLCAAADVLDIALADTLIVSDEQRSYSLRAGRSKRAISV